MFGPAPDLLLGCGLGYAWVFLALAVLGTDFVEAIPMGFSPLILLLTATPHYGATLLRVYEQRDTRRAYALFSVGATVLLAVGFIVSLRLLALGSLLLTIYFNWNPWHYGGQNYGLALMFLRRRGVDVTPLAKRLLYASFVLSAVLAIVEMNGAIPGALYAPIGEQTQAKTIGPVYQFVSIGIAAGWQQMLSSVGLVAYLGCLAGAAVLLLRTGTLRDLGPAAALVATQSLWFVIPGAARVWGLFGDLVPLGSANFNYAFIWIAVGHSVQYLWITTYYAQRTEHFDGVVRYYAKCILAGSVVWNLPALVFAPGVVGTVAYSDGLFLLTAAVVNLHHFVLDGAIWKLRNPRIANILIRSQTETVEPIAAPRRSWIEPLVWATGVVCTAVLIVGTLEREFGFRRAARRADYTRMERAAERLHWIGQDEAALHRHLGALSLARGEADAAVRQYGRSLEIRDHPKAHFELGGIYAARGDWARAADAYDAAYRIDPFPLTLIVRLSEALVQAGRTERAREVLSQGLERHPGDPVLRERLRLADAAATPG